MNAGLQEKAQGVSLAHRSAAIRGGPISRAASQMMDRGGRVAAMGEALKKKGVVTQSEIDSERPVFVAAPRQDAQDRDVTGKRPRFEDLRQIRRISPSPNFSIP